MPTKLQRALTWLTSAGRTSAAQARTDLDVPSTGAVTSALALKLDASEKGAPGGVANSDLSGDATQTALNGIAYLDTAQHVFGREYLAHYYDKIIARETAAIRINGNSTKAGGAGHSLRFAANISDALRDEFAVTVTNTAVGGARTYDWIGVSPSVVGAGGYLATDLAANPDLYIVGWPSPNDVVNNGGVVWTIEQTLAAFETGLQTIRASKTVAQMSVLVVSDAAMNDPVNGRDDDWFRAVNLRLRELCREYECAFLDLYSLGTAVGGAGIWYDDPFADGRSIHPLDNWNAVLTSAIIDILAPRALRTSYGNFRLRNLPASLGTFAYGVAPNQYARGIQMGASLVAQGHPFDGFLGTFINADGSGLQVSADKANPVLRFRMGEGATWRSLEFQAGTNIDAAALPSSFPLGWSGRLAGVGWPAGTTSVLTFASGSQLAIQFAVGSAGSFQIRTGQSSTWASFVKNATTVGSDDIEITDATKGIILRDSNGVRYRVTVSTAGALVVTAL